MIKRIVINFFRDFLSLLGIVWTFTEIFDFFAQNISDWLSANYKIILIATVIVSIFIQFRLIIIKKRIKGTDISIEVKVGNLFRQKGNKIIGVNTNFDTRVDNNYINPDSVHGQFINKYYKNNVNKLDLEILTELNSKQIINTNCCTVLPKVNLDFFVKANKVV